ncbi:Nn.00g064320.m01.CDS01 [Neocucurbitaria sp. VM-36]
MVNAKNVAFKVNKQTPFSQTLAGAYGTVINCRKPGGKGASREQKEVRSHHVPLANVPGASKRKRGEEGKSEQDHSTALSISSGSNATKSTIATLDQTLLNQQWQQRKPTRLRKGKMLSKGVDLDCWFTILSFSDPAQLLEMRSKIASCYRFLRDNPMLWKHSRNYYYGSNMPDPPSQLTEFQYAHLRHGHGCMSCHAPNTRKTYWAFLRRWCKTCLQSKTLKEQDAMVLLRNAGGEDISYLHKALPSGIFDSWGNFVGVGPASTHSLKTIYLLSDVQKLIAEYTQERQRNPDEHDELRVWHATKVDLVEERKAFAKKMELWEETTRTTKSFDYQAKKSARKAYFEHKALQLNPPISLREMEGCPSYRRAIAIPKEPNNTSWLQLKPKLEKEAADMAAMRAQGGTPDLHPITCSTSGTSTPNSSMEIPQPFLPPILGYPVGPPPPHSHLF